MKILLTGGSGMVGRNILENEKANNYEIIAPASAKLNLLDRKAVENFLSLEKPDLIIHSAGRVGGIQANMADKVSFLIDNLKMGLNLVSAASSIGIPKLINIASSCMYPRDALNPICEDMILKGELEPTNEGYALAKIVTLKLCEYIAHEDVNKVYRTIIPCNLYGRHDKFDPKHSHLLPAVIQKIHNAKLSDDQTVKIWGDGNARREFMYAKDIADFVFFAVKNIDKIPQNINVGLGHDYSITDYYKAVAEVIGYNGNFEFDLNKPVGMKQKLVDVTKLQTLGWSHKTSLIDGINKTYKFYKENLNYEV